MSKNQTIDLILLTLMYGGPVEDEINLYRSMQEDIHEFDIDGEEFAVLWGSLRLSGLIEKTKDDAGAPTWFLTAKAVDHLDAGADDPPEDGRYRPHPVARVAVELRRIAEALERGFKADAKELREIRYAIAREIPPYSSDEGEYDFGQPPGTNTTESEEQK